MKAIIKNEISWQKIKDKIFIFNEKNGNSVCLEDSGVEFWILLQDESDIEIIIHNIADLYEVNESEIKEDFFELLVSD